MLNVKHLKRWSDFSAVVPFDFELIVGNGDQKKTIRVNRAILLCSFPHIETRFGDALTDTKLELPELDPWAVESVLGAFSSRKEVRMPYWEREQGAFYKVKCAFGKSTIEIAKEIHPTSSLGLEHPAIADPRWLDASFLCGPQREEIKVNRPMLASMNPVLNGVLFGTDLMPVDPSKPIEWPDFDAQAVRQVFLALLHCGKKEFVVPMESVESAKMLVEYLVETREALMLIYNAVPDAPAAVPFDLELIVGNGDKMKTIRVNRAVLLCCFPHVENALCDALMDTKLELPELDPQAVQIVLGAFSSREKVSLPYRDEDRRWRSSISVAIDDAQRVFGKSMIEIANEESPTGSPRLEHPAMADPRWFDASFLCGPQREEIKVNRAVLASMNPVLNGLLFGTDLIPVDPPKPIEWPDYDAQAVRYVFLALLHCGKRDFVVPMESVESVKMLVNYLVETREALMLYYDTPFKREYQGRYTLRSGKEEGLKFSYD
jgi:hypothetical protein